MVEMTGFLIILIFILPIFIGIVLHFIDSDSPKTLLLILSACLLLCVFWLSQIGEVDIVTPLSFMGEAITFSITNTALLIFFVSLIFLPGMILMPSDEKFHISGFKTLLLSISISFGFIAFVSGQFMIRYIALDIVGLIAALMVIKSLTNQVSFSSFTIIFAILRFGDLSLLASILLLYSNAGTLDITQMINASTSLPMNVRLWVFGGFFVAVLVKTAVWPFILWMRHARFEAERETFWVSGILMPSLGYYLLYRIQPLIVSSTQITSLVILISGILILLMILLDFLNRQSIDRFSLMSGLLGCFLFAAAAFGPKDYFKVLIAGFLFYRFMLYLQEELLSSGLTKFVVLMPLIINSLYAFVSYEQTSFPIMIGWVVFTMLVSFWDLQRDRYQKLDYVNSRREKALLKDTSGNWIEKGALWLNQNLEIEVFTNGVYTLGQAFKQSAIWINEKIEIGVFTNGFYRLGDALEGSASWLSGRVEQGMERFWSWIGNTLMKISEASFIQFEVESSQKSEVLLDNALNSLDKYEQNVLRKNLRLDLAWIPLFLLIIFVLILIV
jgi:hypothetical protein